MAKSPPGSLDHPSPVLAAGSRPIGWAGTSARGLAGLLLLALAILTRDHSVTWWQPVLGLLGFPAVLTAAQLARLAFTASPLRQTDGPATAINCALLVGLLSFSPTRGATLIFLGASMLLAAVRGYAGCESLAVSNWLLRRDDQVGCLLFWPIDVMEARQRGRRGNLAAPRPPA